MRSLNALYSNTPLFKQVLDASRSPTLLQQSDVCRWSYSQPQMKFIEGDLAKTSGNTEQPNGFVTSTQAKWINCRTFSKLPFTRWSKTPSQLVIITFQLETSSKVGNLHPTPFMVFEMPGKNIPKLAFTCTSGMNLRRKHLCHSFWWPI